MTTKKRILKYRVQRGSFCPECKSTNTETRSWGRAAVWHCNNCGCVWEEYTDNGELRTRLAEVEAENRKLRDALTEIRDQQGKVCDEYELCNHESCRSSYASWAIASRALERGSDDDNR